MKRRELLLTPLAQAAACLGAFTVTDAVHARSAQSKFAHLEAGIADLQARLGTGRLTSRTLVLAYLSRIEANDRHGPKLHSVIEANPDAVSIAAELDRERRLGKLRGPLHGIPVLAKDNLASADRMQTTAGSLALDRTFNGWSDTVRPPRDSFVVARLRAAGAIMLGKANLSEWANIRSTRSTSGWSARGGLVRNPYALDRNASGSSSGTAAAIAASFATVGIGTETDGSIVSPSAACGLVGIKPTVGLVSRDGIVPISHSQDTAGPMCRTVADAAMVLSAIAGPDPRDPATQGAPSGIDYAQALDADGLRGARIGVLRQWLTGHPATDAVFERALQTLAARGAVLVDPVRIDGAEQIGVHEIEVLLTEFKVGVAAWLREFAPGAPVQTLADLIAFNEKHAAREMPFFGQELFLRAEQTGGLADPKYLAALETSRRLARTEGIDAALQTHRLDALVAPTRGPAWLTDLVLGDRHGRGFSSLPAVAGYPHVTLPMGQVEGLPVNLSLAGGAWSEPTLIRLAFAFEQASRARFAPAFARSATLSA
jgi:amidase